MISAVTPMLKVNDLEKTIAFYSENLGFSVENRRDGWCAMGSNGASVMFYSQESLDSPPGPPSMTGVLYFNPTDVKALWEKLKGRAPIEWELQEMEYGMLEFAIRDCNGYILSFGQEI
jgi:uncharacterized glyoxalase superfamily protein PhnB